MNKLVHSSLYLAIATLVTACPLLEIELEVPAVCVTVQGVEVVGVPDDVSTDVSLELVQTIDITEHVQGVRDALSEQGVSQTVTLASFSATIEPGVGAPSTFSFLEKFQVTLRDTSDVSNSLSLVDCTDCWDDTPVLAVDLPPVDVTSYLDANAVELGVSLLGHFPRETWSMSVELCFGATVRVERDL